ncbi:MAG: SDR family oxidoreductase [Acidobacteriota bacterium]
MRKLLILGATSIIAQSIAREFARNGYSLFLAGRDLQELERLAEDLKIRAQAEVHWGEFEATDYERHPEFIQGAIEALGGLTGAILCFGCLGDQELASRDFQHARRIIESNYLGAVSLLTPVAGYLETKKHGFIVGLSSVAGDRGRQSNYIYGSAKGAFSLFLQGLRNRLAPAGVQVIAAKLGFVDTRMTYGKPGIFLAASPEKIGRGVYTAVSRSRNVIYLPWFWRPVMAVLRLIPESIFKRLKL